MPTPRAESTPRSLDPAVTELVAKTIKGLAMDAVEAANSGHPGMPMGCADLATVLWTEFLTHDPADPEWFDRDRFVLSAGHGSMLLYALLHLTGYDLSLDELKNFRQWGSKTPGHPEYGHTPGVDVTTGPLGSGVAAGVGMALAERFLADRYNTPTHTVVDHMTWGIVGDGDLMEGIAAEAASLAGHLGLGKLVYLYDDNKISIDGSTDISFTEDVGKRFEAYGWQVLRCDGHDHAAIRAAITAARAETGRPSLICCRTTIANGAPTKAGTSGAHGAPLGKAEVEGAKQAMGWPLEPFHVPAEVRDALAAQRERLGAARAEWNQRVAGYEGANGGFAAEFAHVVRNSLPAQVFAGFDELLNSFPVGGKVASRKAGQKVLAKLAGNLPTLLGGSADLAGSNGVVLPDTGGQSKADPSGRNIHFGVREHGMAGIANGMALHGGVRVFDATFLVFSDFMRGAVRLSALMNLPVVHVFTHDSFWLGEDGPTHQPIEHAMSLHTLKLRDKEKEKKRKDKASKKVKAQKLAVEREKIKTAKEEEKKRKAVEKEEEKNARQEQRRKKENAKQPKRRKRSYAKPK